MITISKESAVLGASVSGLDLSVPINEQDKSELTRALAEHQVLFFRGQHISPAAHRDLGLAFGSLQRHPSYPSVDHFPEIMVLENDHDNPSRIDEWHTDMSFDPKPPLGSILIGRIMPEHGGDTMFSSLAAAYDDLPGHTKIMLEGKTATHSFAYGFKESIAEPGGRERLREAIDNNPDVVHPVIRTHPVTGRKMVFINRVFTRHINGMSQQGSDELINSLCDHMVQDKYVYRFKWQQDSIAFWDNRSVLHVPVNDYWPALRRMERVTINDSHVPA